METSERNKTEILNLEVFERRNSCKAFHNGSERAEEMFSKLQEKSIIIIQSKQHKEKRMKIHQQTIRHLRDTTKYTNIHTIEVPEEEAREKGN